MSTSGRPEAKGVRLLHRCNPISPGGAYSLSSHPHVKPGIRLSQPVFSLPGPPLSHAVRTTYHFQPSPVSVSSAPLDSRSPVLFLCNTGNLMTAEPRYSPFSRDVGRIGSVGLTHPHRHTPNIRLSPAPVRLWRPLRQFLLLVWLVPTTVLSLVVGDSATEISRHEAKAATSGSLSLPQVPHEPFRPSRGRTERSSGTRRGLAAPPSKESITIAAFLGCRSAGRGTASPDPAEGNNVPRPAYGIDTPRRLRMSALNTVSGCARSRLCSSHTQDKLLGQHNRV
jgi:hypothetical protein